MEQSNFKNLQQILKELWEFALETSDKRIPYDSQDLINVTFLFMNVVSNLFYERIEKQWIDFETITKDEKEKIFKNWHTMWSQLHSYIKKYTGIDTKEVYWKDKVKEDAILNYPYLKDL